MGQEGADYVGMQEDDAIGASSAHTLFGVLSGLVGRDPSVRRQLRETAHEPAPFEFDEDVLEVTLGIDVQAQAVVDEGIGVGEPLATADRAGEQKVSASHGKETNSTFDAAVIDFETTIHETPAQEGALSDRVLRRHTKRRFGQQLRMHVIDPCVERIQDRNRSRAPYFTPLIGIEPALLALRFNGIQFGERLQSDGGPLVFTEQRRVELAPYVHAAPKPSFVGHRDERLAIFALGLGTITGISIALDIAVDGRKPIANLFRLPARRIAVGNALLSTDLAVGPHETPKPATKCAVLHALVQRLEMRIVGADCTAPRSARRLVPRSSRET